LARRLAEKGYEEKVICDTLDGLEKQGLLSDKKFAQDLVSQLTAGRPSGLKKISFELKRRGISSKIREEVLSSITPEDEAACARQIGLARWERLERFEPEKRKKRVYDFLVRRGFDYQLVRDLIEKFETQC